MDAKTFFDKVALMRRLQNAYLQDRSIEILRKVKKIEKEVDMEIYRVTYIVGARIPHENFINPFK